MLDALSGLSRLPHSFLRRLVERRIGAFAQQLIAFDDHIARDGLAAASAWGLAQWAGPVLQTGEAPAPGRSLLLVSNHPGLVDALALLSRLAAHDVRLLVAERPLFHALPALRQHLIMIADDGGSRARALRAGTRHLRGGGTLVTYPAGRIEPDPVSDLPAALAALERWSPSAVCFARRVPDLTVQPIALGNVIALRYRRHWLARRAAELQRRDAVAAALQVLDPRPHGGLPLLMIGAALSCRPAAGLHDNTRRAMDSLLRDVSATPLAARVAPAW